MSIMNHFFSFSLKRITDEEKNRKLEEFLYELKKKYFNNSLHSIQDFNNSLHNIQDFQNNTNITSSSYSAYLASSNVIDNDSSILKNMLVENDYSIEKSLNYFEVR